MLNSVQATFAETDENHRSECHAWSASPLYHFNKIILGIEPVKPGFKEVLIKPNFGDLKCIDAVVSTKYGDIVFNLEDLALEIDIPKGIKGSLVLTDTTAKLNPGRNLIKLKK